MSVWVEIAVFTNLDRSTMSRSTWACELKFDDLIKTFCYLGSRSTWACELKLLTSVCLGSRQRVTLHVSVWVEISLWVSQGCSCRVTLHVSVWVEIWPLSVCLSRAMSRSTWACELKSTSLFPIHAEMPSRSTWACELKFCKISDILSMSWCHAPRERVSWNRISFAFMIPLSVTLHVSVWVEIFDTAE